MQSPPFPRYLVPPRSKYSPQHHILNTLSFLSSLNISDQFSHPYKTTGKIIVLYILIFKLILYIFNIEHLYAYFNDNHYNNNKLTELSPTTNQTL